jgi:hypothetical protein
MKLPLFLMVFVNVYIHFRIWTRIRNPRVTDPDPAKDPAPDPQHWLFQRPPARRNAVTVPSGVLHFFLM